MRTKFKAGTIFRLVDLDGPQQWLILSDVLRITELPKPESLLDPGHAMVFWTAGLLHRMTSLTDMQREIILISMGNSLIALGRSLASFYDSDPGEAEEVSYTLAFADAQFAMWTGKHGFLDLKTGAWIITRGAPFLETTAFHLGELFRRQCLRAMAYEDKESHDASHHDGIAEEAVS